MKFKFTVLIVGVLFTSVISSQNEEAEIRGKISSSAKPGQPLEYFKAKLSFKDSLFFTEDCDVNGDVMFKVPAQYIKKYKTVMTVYQDAELLKKNYPANSVCPFVYWGPERYLAPQPATVEYQPANPKYLVKFDLPASCFLPKMVPIGFKRGTLELERYTGLNSDTTLICIANTLKENPNLFVQVVGYCWRENHPETFSLQRAQFIKNKLVKLGIDSLRMQAIGEGEKKHIATTIEVNSVHYNREDVLKAFAVNRRVEIKVIAFDYDPKTKKRVIAK